ncbi:MAG: hypothetical protein JXA69_06505 [Phycisphaerae bacterium]|nr:hypothetical protein [Phycisphaerae bacterium]
MDSETLEKLMIDRALGAMPPDCEILLAAYLETHPDAAAECGSIEQAVELARQALTDGSAATLPAFPAERLREAQRTDWLWRMTRAAAGIAASVVLGFGAHAMFFPAATPETGMSASSLIAVHGPEQRTEEIGEDAGFWSGERLREQVAEAPRQETTRLVWDSPVRVPRIRGAS